MKTKTLLSALLLLLCICGILRAQEIDNHELARRILTKTFNVQPGNIVVINGGQHTLDLLEAFTIETYKLGAYPIPIYNTDKITKSYISDFPEEHYGKDNKYSMSWLKLVDVYISLPGVENTEDVYKDVSQEKFAKMNKAAQAFNDLINSLKLKGGYVGYPTEFDAKNDRMDYKTYKDMIWQAINADYVKISQHAQKLEKLLKTSKKVEISTPWGTELNFSVTGRECFIADGIIDNSEAISKLLFKRWVNFPEGNITVSIIEHSGNGKVFVPKRKCNFESMENISFIVKNGRLMDFKAEKGQDCFLKEWNEYESPKEMAGLLVIGLNPNLKVMEDNSDYRPSNAEGMVYVIFGDNSLHGGKNKVIGAYSAWFPISNATVKIDGKEVVKDGKLILD